MKTEDKEPQKVVESPSRHHTIDSSSPRHAESQIRQLTQKVHRNIALISTTQIQQDKINMSNFLSILKTEQSKRSLEEVTVLKYYLQQSNLTDKFKKDGIDPLNYEKMIIISSTYVNHVHICKNEVLFDFASLGLFTYVIAQGEVSVYAPKENIMELTGYEYFEKLVELYRNGYNHLLKMTIGLNQPTYKIEPNDIPNLCLILFKIEYLKRENTYEIDEELFSFAKLKSSDFGIDLDKMGKIAIQDRIREKIKIIPHELCGKYMYLTDKEEKHQISIFYFELDKVYQHGEYLGDVENGLYKYKAIAKEDTDLCVLNNYIYGEYVSQENKKAKMRELSFIFENFFFGSIVKRKFDREYFPFFIQEFYKKGDIIFNENDEVKYVYFIEEGNVELNSTKSVVELHGMIQILTNISYDVMNKNYISNQLSNLQNQPLTLLGELNNKQSRRFFILERKETMGMESLLYGLNHLFTSRVVSEKAAIYKISVKHLVFIFKNEEQEVYDDFKLCCRKKLQVISDRVANVNKTSLEIIDRKISLPKLKEDFFQEPKKEKRLNCSMFINENKVKNNYDLSQKKKEANIEIMNESFDNCNNKVIRPVKTKKSLSLSIEIKNTRNFDIPLPPIETKKSIKNLIYERQRSFEDRFFEKVTKEMKNSINSLASMRSLISSPVTETDSKSLNSSRQLNNIIDPPNTSSAFITSIGNLPTKKSTIKEHKNLVQKYSYSFRTPNTIEKLKKYNVFDKGLDYFDYNKQNSPKKESKKIRNLPPFVYSSVPETGALFRDIFNRQKFKNKLIVIKKEKNVQYQKKIREKINQMFYT